MYLLTIVLTFYMQIQRGFVGLPVLIWIVLGLIVVGGGAYFVVHQNSVPQSPIYQDNTITPPTTQTTTNPPVQKAATPSKATSFVGTKTTFLPDRIASIDTSNKTFVIDLETKTAPIPTQFRVTPQTVIKKENNYLTFGNLSVNDVVWIRAVSEGQNKYVVQQMIITNDWRNSLVIIKKIDVAQSTITAEVFLSPEKRGQQWVLTIIPETEIRKGTVAEGQNRKIVGLRNLAVGDIAGVSEIGFGIHPADDTGPFYVTDIDVVSPYYCEQYLKPPGCIEKDQSSSQTSELKITSLSPSVVSVGSTITVNGNGFSYQRPADQAGMNTQDAIRVIMQNANGQKLSVFYRLTGQNASDNLITFTLPSQVCTFTERGCDNSGPFGPTSVTPGVYLLSVLIPNTGAVSNNMSISVQ